MDVFHGKLRSAIKVFPDSHKNNITNNNWKGFSMGGTVLNHQKQGRFNLYYNCFLSLETAIEKYVNIEH